MSKHRVRLRGSSGGLQLYGPPPSCDSLLFTFFNLFPRSPLPLSLAAQQLSLSVKGLGGIFAILCFYSSIC